MKTIVLGAGIVGTATAYFLAKQGHEVEVVERQPGAALETSFGNGGVIHASEVEPWSQPEMPRKILSCLGQENPPLLLRPLGIRVPIYPAKGNSPFIPCNGSPSARWNEKVSRAAKLAAAPPASS